MSVLRRALVGALTLGILASPSARQAGAGRLPAEPRERLAAAVGAYQAGDWAGAARGFGEVAPGVTPIPEYVLYLLADSLARAGDVAGARAAAGRAVDQAGDGPLLPAALLLVADQAARAGDHAAATAAYRRFLDRVPDHPEGPAARYALGQSLEAAGLDVEALRAYRALWLLAPASAYAESAARRERILVDRGVPAPPLGQRERLERAERLLAAGQATIARVEAEALVAEGPPVEIVLPALRVVAEGWRRTGRADEALRAVDRALALAPAERRPPWLLERARLSQRTRDQALATLDRLLREHPRSREAPEALLLRAQILEDAPSLAEAAAAYRRVAADYPDSDEAGTALWRLGWLSWLRGASADAARPWTRLATLRGGQRLREAADYWTGRAHAAAGDGEAAARQWGAVVASAPRSYYGILASARLGRPAGPPRDGTGPGVALPADPLDLLKADARYAKVESLRAIGLGPFADGELDELARRSAGDPARLYAVSAAWTQEARPHLALRILRREFFPLARSGHGGVPRLFWEMFYPLGWQAELTSAAGRAALDPFFVAAVVREESSFDPRARSRVGARGLMQLMPETARAVARQRGVPLAPGADGLEEPVTNLELGTAFIGQLVREFGDPRLAVAAYNAGPRRVREWWGTRRSDDVEVWIEQIPFTETRAFVKRVMLAWEEYRRVYGARP